MSWHFQQINDLIFKGFVMVVVVVVAVVVAIAVVVVLVAIVVAVGVVLSGVVGLALLPTCTFLTSSSWSARGSCSSCPSGLSSFHQLKRSSAIRAN